MDYLDFYSLKEHPFSLSADDRFYFNSAQHARILTKMKYTIDERRGLGVLVGALGTGKTTLARRLLEEMDESAYEAALLSVTHPVATAEWILGKIAAQIGAGKPAGEPNATLEQIYHRLVEIDEAGKKAVVLIDEAQMLRQKEIMVALRGLLNMEPEGHKLIAFILFGTDEIDDGLAAYPPLRQQVSSRYRISVFPPQTTAEYVRHRMSVGGTKKAVFAAGAYDIIHRFSGGVPRVINIICDNAMLEGYLLKRATIDEVLLKEVVIDLNLQDTTQERAAEEKLAV